MPVCASRKALTSARSASSRAASRKMSSGDALMACRRRPAAARTASELAGSLSRLGDGLSAGSRSTAGLRSIASSSSLGAAAGLRIALLVWLTEEAAGDLTRARAGRCTVGRATAAAPFGVRAASSVGAGITGAGTAGRRGAAGTPPPATAAEARRGSPMGSASTT